MAGRRIEDAAEARRCLEAARASRQTVGAWCRQAGIDGRSLNAWRMNLERASAGSDGGSRAELVELVVGRGPSASGLSIRCGPFVVEVDGTVDSALLGRVLRVLVQC